MGLLCRHILESFPNIVSRWRKTCAFGGLFGVDTFDAEQEVVDEEEEEEEDFVVLLDREAEEVEEEDFEETLLLVAALVFSGCGAASL